MNNNDYDKLYEAYRLERLKVAWFVLFLSQHDMQGEFDEWLNEKYLEHGLV